MRILIADDDKFSRRLLAATLNNWGFDSVEAKDGVEALDILQGMNPPFLAIIDGFMPRMNGLDVVRNLRQQPRPPHVYVIMVTGTDSNSGLADALEAGVDAYIIKPFKPEELRARIKVGAKEVNQWQALKRL